jgi:vitamin B12 transporter
MEKNIRQYFACLHFRAWTRKGFAVLNSLKRTIKICVLPLVYTIIINNIPLIAQSDTIYISREINVEEVEIIGQRTPGVYSDIARTIAVITKEELDHAPVQTINDLIEFLPNVDLRQRGNLDVQADIGIRGGSFDQNLILINGIPFNDPQTGHHNLNLPFDLTSVEKIEILEGPGSRVYGANAFSGAINIITKSGYTDETDVLLTAGQNSYFKTSLSAGHSFKNLAYYIGFSGSSSAGYTDNTDFQNFNAYYKGDYKSPIGKFEFQAGYLNKAFGANGFYTPRYPEQFEQIKNRFVAFTYSTGKTIKTKFCFSWRRHQDRFELFREERYHLVNGYYIKGSDTASFGPGAYYSGHNYHLTNSFYTGFNTIIPGKSGNSSLGLEYQMNHINSNLLGTSLSEPVAVPGENGVFYTKGASRELFNIFLEHTKNFGWIYISGGGLLNISNDYGYNLFFGGELSKPIKKHGKLFFSVNQSLRLPTFTDLYYNGPTNVGNIDLKPEKAVTFEVGHRMSFNRVKIEISAFDRIGRNIIDWVKLPEEDIYTTKNQTRLVTYGFDITSNINTGLIPAFGSWIKYIYLSYSLVNTDKNSGDYISAYTLDYLRHKLAARINHQIFHSFGLSWDLTLQDRNGTYTDRDGLELDYKPFLLVNARLYWKPGITEIFLEASNLFDVKYRDLGSAIQPGLWLFGGLNVKLGSSDL